MNNNKHTNYSEYLQDYTIRTIDYAEYISSSLYSTKKQIATSKRIRKIKNILNEINK